MSGEVERFLRPGERIVFQARPRWGPPLARTGDLIFYCNWLLFVGFLGVLWVFFLKRPLFFGFDPTTWDPINMIPAGVLLFVAGLLAYQVAAWHAVRCVLTDRRLLLIEGVVRRQARSWERTGRERLVKRLDRRILLEGLDELPVPLPDGLDEADVDALSRALGEPELS